MKIIFMTAGQIADEVGVSQGSVSRFFINLNYKGYSDFLQNLQDIVRLEMTLSQKYEFNSGISSDDISNILVKEHSNIDLVAEVLKHPSYMKLKEKIINCEKLYLVSSRISATLLPYCFYMFNKIRDNVVVATPDSPEWNTVALSDKSKTLIVSCVFPRYSSTLLKKLKELKDDGFDVIAITDADFLSIKGFVDEYVKVPITIASIFDIYSAPMLFINFLIRDVAKGIKGLENRIKVIEEIEQRSGTYYINE